MVSGQRKLRERRYAVKHFIEGTKKANRSLGEQNAFIIGFNMGWKARGRNKELE
jgi:hypothetical protein